MKVISWNILANEFIKKADYPMIKSKMLFNRKGRLTQITSILKNVNADVILLQEVMQAEYNSLSETFNKDYYIIKGNNINWYNKKSYSGNVTFLRKKVFSLSANNVMIKDLEFGLYVKCYFLDKEQAKNVPKNVPENVCENVCAVTSSATSETAPQSKVNKNVAVKPNLKDKLTPIDIINVHLDDISHAKRIAEIKSMEEEIKKSKKVILGGDFNQDYKPKSSLYKLLNQVMGLKIYIKDPTYLIEKKMCIDHLMTKGFGRDSCGCVVNNYGDDVLQQFNEYGSDHLPIIIKL
jgi:endonuclease/exonuclease/phosphatase family metal-dependent hydrolase